MLDFAVRDAELSSRLSLGVSLLESLVSYVSVSVTGRWRQGLFWPAGLRILLSPGALSSVYIYTYISVSY